MKNGVTVKWNGVKGGKSSIYNMTLKIKKQ